MNRPRLLLKPTPATTRVLLSTDDEEILRASLPPPPLIHPRAAPTLCEALALWLQQPLSVVLLAAGQDSSFAPGLSDGDATVHYEVALVDPARRRRALGSFRDLRQLDLRGVR